MNRRIVTSHIVFRAALFGSVLVALVGLSAARTMSAQELTPVFVVPTDPVTAGDAIRVWLVVLNGADHPLPYTFPAHLEGRLRSGAEQQSVSGTLRDNAGAGDVVIPPAGHVRREYVVKMPAGIEGQVVFSVPAIAASGVVLEVRQVDSVPKAAEAAPKPSTKVGEESSAAAFLSMHLSGYEPFYFIAGPEHPTAKFQISFKLQLFSAKGSQVQVSPPHRGLYLAYTQTSLWDLTAPSAPFVDTSYIPEIFYLLPRADGGRWGKRVRLDLQAGLLHESNGKAGADSRSLNIAYVEPKLAVGPEGGLQFSLAPRVWSYLGDLSDNPDIDDFRGHLRLQSTLGWSRGLLLSATGRLGNDVDRGSLQLDLSFPLIRWVPGKSGLYLYSQYFLGYGDSLLHYNERSSLTRFGVALFR